jgi:1,4-dihydroxy-2-naphthoate octaprenyltransferase
MRSKLSLWAEAVRVPFFTASIVPVLLGSVVAWAREDTFHWGFFLLALLGGVLLHAGTNVANDYYDHLSGTDEANVHFVRPFTGGSRMIQRGLLRPREMLTGALILFAAGALIGVYLALARGPWLWVLGIVGIFSGFFYTAPPFRIAATGLGELLVGLNFGVLMTLGAFYVQTKELAWEPVIAAIPVSLLIAGVLYINQFQDMEADASVRKDHLVVRLGRRRGVWLYQAILGATYLAIIASVAAGAISPFALLALPTAFIALQAIRTARRHYDDYLKLAPANAAQVMIHMLAGLLLTLGYVLEGAV